MTSQTAAPRESEQSNVLVIGPRAAGPRARVSELWQRRTLIVFFGRRMLEKRYARTILGWIWLPLRPVLAVGSAAFLFGGVLRVPSDGVPYILFLLVGLSSWLLFSNTAYWSTRSLELSRSLLRRMYVPRLTVLIASAAPPVVDFVIYVIIAGIAFACYAVADGRLYLELGPATPLALLGLVLLLLMAFSIGVWTSVVATHARDVRFTLRYILGFWQFVTPVVFPLSAVPPGYRTVVVLNPATAPMQMVRRGLLGIGEIPTTSLLVTAGTLILFGAMGLRFFLRSEALALDNL